MIRRARSALSGEETFTRSELFQIIGALTVEIPALNEVPVPDVIEATNEAIAAVRGTGGC